MFQQLTTYVLQSHRQINHDPTPTLSIKKTKNGNSFSEIICRNNQKSRRYYEEYRPQYLLDGCEEKERKYVWMNTITSRIIFSIWPEHHQNWTLISTVVICIAFPTIIILFCRCLILPWHMSRYHFLLKALSLIKKKPNKLNQFFASNVRCWVSQLQLISEFRRSLMECVIYVRLKRAV